MPKFNHEDIKSILEWEGGWYESILGGHIVSEECDDKKLAQLVLDAKSSIESLESMFRKMDKIIGY